MGTSAASRTSATRSRIPASLSRMAPKAFEGPLLRAKSRKGSRSSSRGRPTMCRARLTATEIPTSTTAGAIPMRRP